MQQPLLCGERLRIQGFVNKVKNQFSKDIITVFVDFLDLMAVTAMKYHMIDLGHIVFKVFHGGQYEHCLLKPVLDIVIGNQVEHGRTGITV